MPAIAQSSGALALPAPMEASSALVLASSAIAVPSAQPVNNAVGLSATTLAAAPAQLALEATKAEQPPVATDIVLAELALSRQAAADVQVSSASCAPPWIRGDMEKPAGTKDMGSWTASVYTTEQQQRLKVDERGNPRQVRPTTPPKRANSSTRSGSGFASVVHKVTAKALQEYRNNHRKSLEMEASPVASLLAAEASSSTSRALQKSPQPVPPLAVLPAPGYMPRSSRSSGSQRTVASADVVVMEQVRPNTTEAVSPRTAVTYSTLNGGRRRSQSPGVWVHPQADAIGTPVASRASIPSAASRTASRSSAGNQAGTATTSAPAARAASSPTKLRAPFALQPTGTTLISPAAPAAPSPGSLGAVSSHTAPAGSVAAAALAFPAAFTAPAGSAAAVMPAAATSFGSMTPAAPAVLGPPLGSAAAAALAAPGALTPPAGSVAAAAIAAPPVFTAPLASAAAAAPTPPNVVSAPVVETVVAAPVVETRVYVAPPVYMPPAPPPEPAASVSATVAVGESPAFAWPSTASAASLPSPSRSKLPAVPMVVPTAPATMSYAAAAARSPSPPGPGLQQANSPSLQQSSPSPKRRYPGTGQMPVLFPGSPSMTSLTSMGTNSPMLSTAAAAGVALQSSAVPSPPAVVGAVQAPTPQVVLTSMPQVPTRGAPEASVSRSTSAPFTSQRMQQSVGVTAMQLPEAPGWSLSEPHASRISGVLRQCKERLATTRREMNEVISQRNALYRSLQQAETDFELSSRDWNMIQEELSTVRRALSVGADSRGRSRRDRNSQERLRGRSPGAVGVISPSSASSSPLCPRPCAQQVPMQEADLSSALVALPGASASMAISRPRSETVQSRAVQKVHWEAADVQEQRRSLAAEMVLGNVQAYMVDNSQLGARTRGLGLRLSPRLDHLDEHTAPLQWGAVVYAKAISPDWAKVEVKPSGDQVNALVQNRFLPMRLDGTPVLTPLSLVSSQADIAPLNALAPAPEFGAEGVERLGTSDAARSVEESSVRMIQAIDDLSSEAATNNTVREVDVIISGVAQTIVSHVLSSIAEKEAVAAQDVAGSVAPNRPRKSTAELASSYILSLTKRIVSNREEIEQQPESPSKLQQSGRRSVAAAGMQCLDSLTEVVFANLASQDLNSTADIVEERQETQFAIKQLLLEPPLAPPEEPSLAKNDNAIVAGSLERDSDRLLATIKGIVQSDNAVVHAQGNGATLASSHAYVEPGVAIGSVAEAIVLDAICVARPNAAESSLLENDAPSLSSRPRSSTVEAASSYIAALTRNLLPKLEAETSSGAKAGREVLTSLADTVFGGISALGGEASIGADEEQRRAVGLIEEVFQDSMVTLDIVDRKLTFKLVIDEDGEFTVGDDQDFVASFNKDGTTSHSARPEGTYTVSGLSIKVFDGEEVTLTFSKASVEVGDIFTVMPGDLKFEVLAVSRIVKATECVCSRGSLDQLLAESARVRLNSRRLLGKELEEEAEDLMANGSTAATRELDISSAGGSHLETRRCSKTEAAAQYITSLVASTLERLEDGDQKMVVKRHVYEARGGAPPYCGDWLVASDEVELDSSRPLYEQWDALLPADGYPEKDRLRPEVLLHPNKDQAPVFWGDQPRTRAPDTTVGAIFSSGTFDVAILMPVTGIDP